jgi:predicted RNA binding protein YcfA (HicA-like mRNA interferase family)
MTQLKSRVVLSGLRNKGFQESNRDHKYLIFYFEGKKTEIRTKISHGSKDIDDRLIHMMAKQLKLSKEDFLDLVKCPMSRETYIQKLQAAGVELQTQD